MKEKQYQYGVTNNDFRMALFLWHGNWESPIAAKKMGDLLTRAEIYEKVRTAFRNL